MRNVLHRPVPKPSEMRADVPPGLEAIVMRALERDVDKRFPDAAAMAAALEDHLREARFSPETVVRLLGELFGEENSGRELPLPDEAALGRRASGQLHPAISSGSLPPMAPLPAPVEEDQGYATVSEVHRLAELATRHRRKRYIQAGAGTLALAAVGLFALSFTTRPPEKPAAPRAAIAPAINVPAAVATATAAAPAPPETIGPETPVAPPPPAMAPEVTPLPPPASKRVRALADDDGDSEHTPTQTTRSRRATPPPATAAPAPAPAPAGPPRGKRSLSLGLAALESGEYLRAATQLEEALEASPNSPEALAGLAEAEFELAHYAKAVFHAHKAAGLAPRNPRYQALLADSLFKLRRYRDAAQAYAQAAALAPNEASLRDRKARAEGLIGSRDEAKSGDNDGE
jgi:serine/threonine-protein kinase